MNFVLIRFFSFPARGVFRKKKKIYDQPLFLPRTTRNTARNWGQPGAGRGGLAGLLMDGSMGYT